MSQQGKQFTPEAIEMIINLKQHFDLERKSGRVVSTRNPMNRAATGLGVGLATVKRVMARHSRSETTGQPCRPGRPPDSLGEGMETVVRKFVHAENLSGRRVSIERVRWHLATQCKVEVPKMSLWRALRRWGFTYGQGRRRNSLKEQDYVIRARREYLRLKRQNRGSNGLPKRPEFFFDETFVNKNHSAHYTWYPEVDGPWVNKPSGVGPRLIVVNAIGPQGWVDGAELVFEAKKRAGDYHGQMNWRNFSKWFLEQLMPNIPEGALVVMDNAKYHNVLVEDNFPNASSTKEEMQDWLTHNGHAWHENMLKSELLEMCRRWTPEPEFRLDRLEAEKGIKVLRTPPYHPELQPIETCWAIVKNHLADNCDFTMKGLRDRLPEAFSKVTATTCGGILSKVKKQEGLYWAEDERLDELYSTDASDERLATIGSPIEGADHYLSEE